MRDLRPWSILSDEIGNRDDQCGLWGVVPLAAWRLAKRIALHRNGQSPALSAARLVDHGSGKRPLSGLYCTLTSTARGARSSCKARSA